MSEARTRPVPALMAEMQVARQALDLAVKVVGGDGAPAYAQVLLARLEEGQRPDTKILGAMFAAQLAAQMKAAQVRA